MKRKCCMRRFTTTHRGDDASKIACKYIVNTLQEKGYIYDEVNPEIVIVVGGDGTLLRAFHDYIDKVENVSFVGIHSGTLGFSTDYTINDLEQFIKDFTQNEPEIDEKRILKADCYNGTKKFSVFALNEIRVENIVKTQVMDVYLDQDLFETFRGNGLCISGQYGSTAYNRSIGGAVIFPGLDLLQMTEISGIHHRHSRSLGAPLILKPDTEIRLKHPDFKHALLCYDHLHLHLDEIEEIVISSFDKTMKFARFNKISHIVRLNSLF